MLMSHHFSLLFFKELKTQECVSKAVVSTWSGWFKCWCVFLVGRIDDGDWSTEMSCVCTWNLDRRGLNPKQADLVIDVPTAVTAVCCHPNQPALIAGTLPVCALTS